MNLPRLKDASHHRSHVSPIDTSHTPQKAAIDRRLPGMMSMLTAISPTAMTVLNHMYDDKHLHGTNDTLNKRYAGQSTSTPTGAANLLKDHNFEEVVNRIQSKEGKGKSLSPVQEYQPRKSPDTFKLKTKQVYIQKSYSIEKKNSFKEQYISLKSKSPSIFEADRSDLLPKPILEKRTLESSNNLDSSPQHSNPFNPLSKNVIEMGSLIFGLPKHKSSSKANLAVLNNPHKVPGYLLANTLKNRVSERLTAKGKDNKYELSLFQERHSKGADAEQNIACLEQSLIIQAKKYKKEKSKQNTNRSADNILTIEKPRKNQFIEKARQNDPQGLMFSPVNEWKTKTPTNPALPLVYIKHYNLTNKPDKPSIQDIKILGKIDHKYQNMPINQRSDTSPTKHQRHQLITRSLNKDQKRAYLLYNLYMGLYISHESQDDNKKKPAAIKFGLGSGNNDKLIYAMLKSKGMVNENFFNKCNLIWTQVTSNRTAVANLASGVTDMDLMDEKTPQNVRYFRIKSVESLEAQIRGLKMFRIEEGTSLIKEVANYLHRRARLTVVQPFNFTLMNHIKGLKYISRKHHLYQCIKKYCEDLNIPLDSIVPQTWVLQGEVFDENLADMLKDKITADKDFKTPLIIKPGENSNRGQGIALAFTEDETRRICTQTLESRKNTSTVVVQTYITNPLLFLKRKFDVRCYALIHRLPGRLSYYWYRYGYARTCSLEYSTDIKDNLMVHLTNEAVQVKGS